MVANKIISHICVDFTELLIKNWSTKSSILVKFDLTLHYKTLKQLSNKS